MSPFGIYKLNYDVKIWYYFGLVEQQQSMQESNNMF